LKTLTFLRDLGNTVIVVEHDEDAIYAADFIVDIGPGAGVHGGEIVATGTANEIEAAHTRSPVSTCAAPGASKFQPDGRPPGRINSSVSTVRRVTT